MESLSTGLLSLFCIITVSAQEFDAEIYPPELKAAHQLMSPEELHHFFGVSDPDKVDHESYMIVEMKSVLTEERARAKRSGERPADRAFRVSAFGNTYNLRMKRNNKLLANNASITVKEGNHTYTEHIVRPLWNIEDFEEEEEEWVPPVAWLEMEMEAAESDGDCAYNYDQQDEENEYIDGSAFCDCDHFIDRSYAESFNVSAVISDCDNEWEDSFYNNNSASIYGKHHIKHHSGWRDISGMIFSSDGAYEIYSVPPKVARMIQEFRNNVNASQNYSLPAPEEQSHHVIFKKATFPVSQSEEHTARPRMSPENPAFNTNSNWTTGKKVKRGEDGKLFVEVGLFMDEPAYTNYHNYFSKAGYKKPDKKIVQLLLAYMNSIQAIYHFDSLGTKVDFSLVHIEIMKTQPTDFYEEEGERGPLLTSFCKYQAGENKKTPEGDAHHWDIGLLVSGEDFWAWSKKQKNYLTMGLATVTGICTPSYGCVIGEMGVRDRNDKPYPSTGFTSVFVMAHEIGHNLGMSHDSSGNACSSQGFVMSPSRGTKGEVVWSQCSKDHMTKLVAEDIDCLTNKPSSMETVNELNVTHNLYQHYPGGVWDKNQQCQALMFDKDAFCNHHGEDPSICYSMKCRSPNRRGYYRSGPALEGTDCGSDKICHMGQCIVNKIGPGEYLACIWPEWTAGSCQSGCIKGSKGYITKTRQRVTHKAKLTKGPKKLCKGKTTEIELCDKQCTETWLAHDYAKDQCTKYLKIDPSLESEIQKLGFQAPHDTERPDVACTVHCKRKGGGRGEWHSLVFELGNRDDVDVYFPDGTFCHRDGSTDYYCREHKCQSSETRGGRADPLPQLDVNIGASPTGNNKPPKEVDNYFSLDDKGKVLSENYRPDNKNEVNEGMWILDQELVPGGE